jgi:hypothetical protein
MIATSAQVMNLQHGLSLSGFWPGAITGGVGGKLDPATVAALDAYWTSKGSKLPQSAIEALGLLKSSFRSADGTVQNPVFSADELYALAMDYAAVKGLGVGGWLKKNWLAVTIVGVVVVGGGAAGGYLWWRKSQEGKATDGLGEMDGGLGCPCMLGLGHGGRTAKYEFPSGTKKGHYRASNGRFHSHG